MIKKRVCLGVLFAVAVLLIAQLLTADEVERQDDNGLKLVLSPAILLGLPTRGWVTSWGVDVGGLAWVVSGRPLMKLELGLTDAAEDFTPTVRGNFSYCFPPITTLAMVSIYGSIGAGTGGYSGTSTTFPVLFLQIGALAPFSTMEVNVLESDYLNLGVGLSIPVNQTDTVVLPYIEFGLEWWGLD